MYDPEGKESLAELTATVMRTGGTEKMSAKDIDEALEFSAASVEPSTSMESTSWSLSVIRKDMDKALEILAQMIQAPFFDEGKLKLSKELKLEEIRRIYDDPQKLAFREFNRLLYKGNARGRQASPTSVKKITREDLLNFHEQYYFPGNIMIAISGDISKVEAIEKIISCFGNWQKKGLINPIPPPETPPVGKIYYLVKDTPQSVVITGQFAPAKSKSGYYAFDVLDFIIGGGSFRSKIFQEIRTNRGLAYSTGSFYRARTDYGIFGTYAITKTESAPSVLNLLKAILQESKKSPPDNKDLERAKRSIVNSFVFQYQSIRQIAGQQMMLEYNKLSADFLKTYCNEIDKLTITDLLNAGQKYLQPDDMTVFILGTAEGYEKMKTIFPNIETIRISHD